MRRLSFLVLLVLSTALARAAVLPEDRADIMYHRYEGGGVTVDGPSVLVRKGIGDSFSVSANYYVDTISSASIDVVTQASPYKEERKQKSLSLDYLRGRSTYSAGVVTSSENDYEADTYFVGLSQDMFGDLTTISLGFSRGWDSVGNVLDPDFSEPVDRRSYRAGLSQIVTRSLIMGLNAETVTEEGYLHNPYRSMRYLTPDPSVYTTGPERYPNTRTSNAFSLRGKYFLPYRAALDAQYRYFSDTWGITGHTATLSYVHPMWRKWIFSGNYRFYTQDHADFYSDLFPSVNFQNFQARDKEISSYSAHTVGVAATYEFEFAKLPWVSKASANVRWDHMMVKYRDFRDLRDRDSAPGSEPLYSLDADIMEFFVSVWF